MTRLLPLLLFGALAVPAGCTSYNIGGQNESAPNGSYAGSTLNSPVSDQNPNPGSDQSYPNSTDEGKQPVPPEKVDGR